MQKNTFPVKRFPQKMQKDGFHRPLRGFRNMAHFPQKMYRFGNYRLTAISGCSDTAAEYCTSAEKVQAEIAEAIRLGMNNPDADVQQAWTEIHISIAQFFRRCKGFSGSLHGIFMNAEEHVPSETISPEN